MYFANLWYILQICDIFCESKSTSTIFFSLSNEIHDEVLLSYIRVAVFFLGGLQDSCIGFTGFLRWVYMILAILGLCIKIYRIQKPYRCWSKKIKFWKKIKILKFFSGLQYSNFFSFQVYRIYAICLQDSWDVLLTGLIWLIYSII